MSSRQQECFPCPANSVAEEEGSVVCLCEEDHFRTPLDTPSAPCTRKKIIYFYICVLCVLSNYTLHLPFPFTYWHFLFLISHGITGAMHCFHLDIKWAISCLQSQSLSYPLIQPIIQNIRCASLYSGIILPLWFTCPSLCILSFNSLFSFHHLFGLTCTLLLRFCHSIYPHSPISSFASSFISTSHWANPTFTPPSPSVHLLVLNSFQVWQEKTQNGFILIIFKDSGIVDH